MKQWFTFLLLIGITAIPVYDLTAKVPSTNSISSVFFQDGLKKQSSELKVFPNPVTGEKIQVSAIKSIKAIQLNNILGQRADIETIRKSGLAFEVKLKDRKQGIYLITVLFEDNSKEVRRIVVN